MAGLDDTRFVRICVHDQFVWGLQPSNQSPQLVAVWGEDWAFVRGEFGDLPHFNGITQDELATLVEATEINTPPEAWTALAYYRLTGQRQNDSEFVKE